MTREDYSSVLESVKVLLDIAADEIECNEVDGETPRDKEGRSAIARAIVSFGNVLGSYIAVLNRERG